MDTTNADSAGGAAPAANNEALAGATAQGSKQGFETGTGGILRSSGTGGKPVSEGDADPVEFSALQRAATRDAWALTRILTDGAPVYLLRRLRFSEVFHDLAELKAFLAARGVHS